MLTREELLNKEIILARKAYFSMGLSDNSGANLILEVFLEGGLDPATELSVNLTEVDKALKHFLKDCDHKSLQKDLGLDIPGFLQKAWQSLSAELEGPYASLCGIKLHTGSEEVYEIGFKR